MFLHGIFVATVTPFQKNGSVDFECIEKYIGWLYDNGIDGVVPCGTTGEFLALSNEEQSDIIRASVAGYSGNGKVIAGASGTTVSDTVKKINSAKACGADAALVLSPDYWNKGIRS